MDISNNNKKIYTTKIFNGETVNYTYAFLLSFFVLIALKQLLKVFVGIEANASLIVSFVIAQILLYLLEKKFVFQGLTLSSLSKEILMTVFRGAVDFGFYKIIDVVFGDMLNVQSSFVWFITFFICFVFNYMFDRLIIFDCISKAQATINSRSYKLFFNNRFILLSVLTSMICMLVFAVGKNFFPFDDYTFMRMDLYHQYGPLFAELYDRVVEHKSFLYSWNTGGGSSFLGNYFNYLSSPLTAIIFLFDKKDISNAITVLIAVKGFLSSATFTYYLKKSLNSHSYASASFGVFYMFSAYFLAYYWNVMWLDGMILLPLIALGIENIIKNGKCSIYIISMCLLFVSSYYMGFMACIFSVVYFLGYFIISSSFSEKLDPNLKINKKFSVNKIMNNKFIARTSRFAVASIFSACICAVVLIPVYLILRSSSATSDSFPTTFTSYFDIFDFLTSHLPSLETTIRSSGDDVLPNVYCGVLTIILVPLYIINKEYRIKEKATYVFLLIFFLISFDNNCFNFVWHALHFPNDLPYRFSYMYIFLMLVIAYKALIKIKSITTSNIITVGMFWLLFVIVAQKMMTTKMSNITIYTSIAFILIWVCALMFIRKGKGTKLISSVLVIALTVCEVVVCDVQSMTISQNNTDYSDNYDAYTQAVDYIHDYDDGFYREELSYLETRMDPSYYDYNGMSVFSSMAYESYSRLQYSLGMFGNRINSYTYFPQTPVYNAMFAIKYLIKTNVTQSLNETMYDYLYTTSDGNADVYENKYSLPIAFCVNSEIEDWDTTEGDPFEIQNEFFKLSTGYANVFDEVEYLDTQFDSADGSEVTENGTYWFSKIQENSSYASIIVNVSPNYDGNVYLYVTSSDITEITVNSSQYENYTQTISEPYILDLGYYGGDEEIEIEINVASSEADDGYYEIYCYSLNQNVFEDGYNALNATSLNVTSYSDTSIKGTITVDENCYLYSSIPYDEGWSIYIDGVKVQTFEIGSTLLGTTIKPGEHEIEYKYTPKGLKQGAVISAISIIGVVGYLTFFNKKKKKNELYS